MNEERINAALEEATDTRNVTIREGALETVPEAFKEAFGAQQAVVVADANTMGVAGEEVQRLLSEAGVEQVDPYVFPAGPTLYADYGNVEKLRDALKEHDAIPVAVGSGTLNDLAKRASGELERPYLCVGTAASMDGYTAFGSSIEKDGHKQTLGCPAPAAVVADVDILVGAPGRMTASGYADLLGKVTSGADWLVADALGVEPIDETGWSLVQDHLRGWISFPAKLREGDEEAMDGLIEGLVMSGLAIQAYQSSRTASGAEHQFSHLWEGEGLGRDDDPPLSHGFKVGVGTIAIAALYERILERDLSNIDVDAIRDSWPTEEEVEKSVRAMHEIDELEEAAVEQSLSKHPGPDELVGRLEVLQKQWPELRGKLEEQLISADQLRAMLQEAGCPTSPGEIGLGRDELRATYFRARTIRSRYTVLDLAVETGVFDECVEELFAPGGFWG